MRGCVYMAENRANGKKYIGKTIHRFRTRRNQHKNAALNDSSYPFHRALKKYGVPGFRWIILKQSDDKEQQKFVNDKVMQ